MDRTEKNLNQQQKKKTELFSVIHFTGTFSLRSFYRNSRLPEVTVKRLRKKSSGKMTEKRYFQQEFYIHKRKKTLFFIFQKSSSKLTEKKRSGKSTQKKKDAVNRRFFILYLYKIRLFNKTYFVTSWYVTALKKQVAAVS